MVGFARSCSSGRCMDTCIFSRGCPTVPLYKMNLLQPTCSISSLSARAASWLAAQPSRFRLDASASLRALARLDSRAAACTQCGAMIKQAGDHGHLKGEAQHRQHSRRCMHITRLPARHPPGLSVPPPLLPRLCAPQAAALPPQAVQQPSHCCPTGTAPLTTMTALSQGAVGQDAMGGQGGGVGCQPGLLTC